MKQILPVGAVLLLLSCASVTFIPRESTFYGIDFRKYTNSGFLFTPEKYIGNYESVGILRYVILPESKLMTIQKKTFADGSSQSFKVWVSEQISVSQGVDSLYSIARRMGADAIINFEAKVMTKDHSTPAQSIVISGLEISGYAIRRKAN